MVVKFDHHLLFIKENILTIFFNYLVITFELYETEMNTLWKESIKYNFALTVSPTPYCLVKRKITQKQSYGKNILPGTFSHIFMKIKDSYF